MLHLRFAEEIVVVLKVAMAPSHMRSGKIIFMKQKGPAEKNLLRWLVSEMHYELCLLAFPI